VAKLDEITNESTVSGVVPNVAVSIIQTTWHGNDVLEIFYKTPNGETGTELLYRDREPTLEVVTEGSPWSFTADGNLFRMLSEAMRINLAHLFDPLVAVHTSLVEPLPHQITAVYEEMLTRQPLRFLLADDPGAGKTIMAGLLIKELLIRGDLKRCMIVSPGNLVEQWQDELNEKFSIPFELMTNDKFEAAHSGNWFLENDLVICRLDKLSRNEDIQNKLKATDWDLIVVDEAHKMSASLYGQEVKETKRYKLGRFISELTRHFLLMSATPHNGKDEDFQLFMGLLDGDRFEGRNRQGARVVDATDMMRRMVKEDLYRFDETRLFPERIAHTVSYQLTKPEIALYEAVSEYVREEFNRVNALENDGRRGTVGFALTILQRRLASSPEAIYQSLKRRKERLEKRVQEEKAKKRGQEAQLSLDSEIPEFDDEDAIDDFEDRPLDEYEEQEESIVDGATAAQTIAELEIEIQCLVGLVEAAKKLRDSGRDKKWEELSSLMQDDELIRDESGSIRKMVIFTEHRDTLNYLAARIRALLGTQNSVVIVSGGMLRGDRRKAQEMFTQDKDTVVFLATDAAGEGINLQCAHLMVNYDLPWNPNRLEQRFGRIHRIGQREVCHLWNLVAYETREGEVYKRLLDKLENERQSLGGAVFDVLGRAIEGKQLRHLLQEAILYGNRPDVKRRLFEKIEGALDHARLTELLEDNSLASDSMDTTRVRQVRDEMERAQASRLQPYFISTFFKQAFEHLGGQMREREEKRFELMRVPSAIRNRDRIIGGREPVLPKYQRVTFEKNQINVHGKPTAAFICPGHPLLDATIDLVMEKYSNLLKQGAVLIHEDDDSDKARALLYLEHSIQDGRVVSRSGARRVVSRKMQFVTVDETGQTQMAGDAPYLDMRPASEEELGLIEGVRKADWIGKDLEQKAVSYAISSLVPQHFNEMKSRKVALVEKTRDAVKQRLTSEIAHWDYRAAQLKAQEESGRQPKMNSMKAQARADDLSARLDKRMEELEQELKLAPKPPIVVGGALVIPRGLLNRLAGKASPKTDAAVIDTKKSEMIAMNAVMKAEKSLGNEPRDVSDAKCGYDIESRDGKTGHLRFIEVKGRSADADTVTVTRNEVVKAINSKEKFILAIVQIDRDHKPREPVYVREPFEKEPDFTAASINYKVQHLIKKGQKPS